MIASILADAAAFFRVVELDIEHLENLILELLPLNRAGDLDTVLRVARHPVSRRDVELRLRALAERIDAPVLEARLRLMDIAVCNIKSFLAGSPTNVVN